MKLLLLLLLIIIGNSLEGLGQSGRMIYDRLYSPALENEGGEDPTRRVSIYLPPNYDHRKEVYPVIYYLHGITQTDSSLIANRGIDKLLDKAISSGMIQPIILVIPDQYTLYRGSFYTNSSLTGNWSHFTAKDLVTYVDSTYRTIRKKEGRGIAGHSMGGHGAIKLAMLYPDVFNCVYALSPYILDLKKDYGIEGDAFKQAQEIKVIDTLITGYKYMNANGVIAAGRAFSPNPNKPPFYTDLPYTYADDSLVVNPEVLELWKRNLPYEMIDDHVDDLEQLSAIKLDWGREDFFTHIPPTSRSFSQKLEELGINHFAEEYNGDHIDKIYTTDGRFLNDMLPFFNTYLKYE